MLLQPVSHPTRSEGVASVIICVGHFGDRSDVID